MIVVDSSALIAIFEKEPDAALYASAIWEADRLLISAVTVYETGIVLRIRHGVPAVARLWRFLEDENDFEIVPFDRIQLRAAQIAFDRFGNGIRSRARAARRPDEAYRKDQEPQWSSIPGISECLGRRPRHGFARGMIVNLDGHFEEPSPALFKPLYGDRHRFLLGPVLVSALAQAFSTSNLSSDLPIKTS